MHRRGALPTRAKPPIPKGNSKPARIGNASCRSGRLAPLTLAVVTGAAEMVRVELPTPEPGVMVAGENEQLKLLGIPAHESAIDVLKAPDCGVAVIVKLPVRPAAMVRAEGDAAKVTLPTAAGAGTGVGGGGVLTHVELYGSAPLIWFASVGFPTACTKS